MRTVEEITQDLKDCYSCESKECLFPIPTICGKPQDASVIAYEAEMGKAIINLFGIGRLEEICNAEREGRCVVLMPQIEFDERLEKLRSVNWKVNSLCRDCGGVPKHLEAELFDMLGVKKAPDGYIDTREAAEAALREREKNDRD